MTEWLDDFLLRAICAGLIMVVIAAPMGCLMVWQRLAFLSDTLGHAAVLGVGLGLFEVGAYQYDSALVLLNIEDAALFLGLEDKVSGIRLALSDTFEAPRIRYELVAQTAGDYYIRDWTQDNISFFSALKIEKRVMFIILALIIMVAAFNIVSTLVMLVTDKQSDMTKAVEH